MDLAQGEGDQRMKSWQFWRVKYAQALHTVRGDELQRVLDRAERELNLPVALMIRREYQRRRQIVLRHFTDPDLHRFDSEIIGGPDDVEEERRKTP